MFPAVLASPVAGRAFRSRETLHDCPHPLADPAEMLTIILASAAATAALEQANLEFSPLRWH